MTARKKYRRRPDTPIVAVRLALETEGFTYRKWGGTQVCKSGDWLVTNGKDTYTIDAEVFARTYRCLGDGRYEKCGEVWAEEATSAGTVVTREGSTDYEAGDFLVSNDANGKDGWAISRVRFQELYEEVRADPTA